MFRIDVSFLIISAMVSLIATGAIMFMVDLMHPDLIVSRGGTAVFIYIGVFTANMIIEAARQRLERSRKKES